MMLLNSGRTGKQSLICLTYPLLRGVGTCKILPGVIDSIRVSLLPGDSTGFMSVIMALG